MLVNLGFIKKALSSKLLEHAARKASEQAIAAIADGNSLRANYKIDQFARLSAGLTRATKKETVKLKKYLKSTFIQ